MGVISELIKELREQAEYWKSDGKYPHDLLNKAADIIEELSVNDSRWILCSDRLPTLEECQKNDCRFILNDGNRRYQGMFDYVGKQFVHFSCNEVHVDSCAIAWQPLPEPYNPQKEC